MGSDASPRTRPNDERSFNPRSRMGSDLPSSLSRSIWLAFQSALPHGERLEPIYAQVADVVFQSALPHGERLTVKDAKAFERLVSIRAPAWGATR